MNCNPGTEAAVEKAPPATSDEKRQEQEKDSSATGVFERRVGGQLDALQSMLSSLAAKVEAMEEEAEQGQSQQSQQGAIADAYKDMTQVEHAVGQLEPRLDDLLSKLDSILKEA
ncbi:hypothetical protein IWW38_004239 [Coemansia aciculifera]|uniref:Uncharacterized protein n=1 Tax=Coemansia aciculifera TaxID=417176 RepID=A0ACC1LZY3_9FUNG|nr:hypothetical protein IWW38_004239 [Coemansia aciculifera]